MMNWKTGAIAVWLSIGCSDRTGPSGVVLEVQVLRGPITPVCLSEHPCEAGFAARFDVYQAGRVEAQFTTDANGQARLRLPPGEYEIVPDARAPLISPREQRRALRVEEPGPVAITLQFDTGLR